MAEITDSQDVKHRQGSRPARSPDTLPKPPTRAWLEKAALFYLERFSASEAQFRRVMTRKIRRRLQPGQTPTPEHLNWLEDVTAKCRRYDYLNDARYAAMRAETLHQRGKPWRQVAQDLKSKGIASDLIEGLSPDADSVSDLLAAVRYIKRRGFGVYARTDRVKPLDKQMAAMARAGFGFALARRVLEADDPEALLDEAVS